MTDLFGQQRHDAGGKVRIRWPAGSVIDAIFSGPEECYRLQLTEIWDPHKPLIGWLMMNPSIAGIEFSDPTLAKTGRISRRLGYGGQWICNVHAYRTTDPIRLLKVEDPVGPGNDIAIMNMASSVETIVVAHGRPPKALSRRGPAVVEMISAAGYGAKLRALRLSPDGLPWHPRFVPESSPLIRLPG